MKNKPQNAVAFLLFYILLSLFLFGLIYGFLSDIRDKVIPVYTTLGLLSPEYSDADSLWGFNALNFMLSFSIVFFVISIIWYSFQMAQRPLQQWG